MLLSQCKVAFTRFGEFGLETRYRVREAELQLLGDGQTLTLPVDVVQAGQVIARAQVWLVPVASALPLEVSGVPLHEEVA